MPNHAGQLALAEGRHEAVPEARNNAGELLLRIAREAEGAEEEQPLEEHFHAQAQIAAADQHLLEEQDHYVEFVREAGINKAMEQFKSTSRVNVGLALFRLGCIQNDGELQSGAYDYLRETCVAIAFNKDLGHHHKWDSSVWGGPLDEFLVERWTRLTTPLETARLLIKNCRPGGGRANFARLLGQRLMRVLGWSQMPLRASQPPILSIDEPDGLQAFRMELADGFSLTERVIKRDLVARLGQGLNQFEIKLWALVSQGRACARWHDIAQALADGAGNCPTANAIRKQWERLRTRLLARYRELTGQDRWQYSESFSSV